MARTFDLNFYRFVTGQSTGSFLTPEQAEQYPMDDNLAGFIRSRSRLRAVGTPEQVKAEVEQVANSFGADEIMAVTNMYYFEDRKRSFELLKAAFS